MQFKSINLKEVSSLKIGPIVPYLEVNNGDFLPEILKYAKKNKLKIHILGSCTNSYFDDSLKNKLEKKYLFVKLNFHGVETFYPDPRGSGYIIEAQANVNWHTLVKFTIEKKLWGLENLSYIPGTVGAAPVQNIGAYGTELKETFVSVKVFDIKKNKIVVLKNKDCKFGNRDSIFKKNKNGYIILSIKLKLSKNRNPILNYKPLSSLDKQTCTLQEISELVIKTRKEKIPNFAEFPNCGSFFKNPKVSQTKLKSLQKKFPAIPYFKEKDGYKIPTAWFIDHLLKIKGKRFRNFGTAENHSLVLVNYTQKGSATELNKFVEEIKERIYKLTKIKIEQEVNYIS